MLQGSNLLGAAVTMVLYLSTIVIFAFRLAGRPQTGHSIGYVQLLMVIPLGFLLWKGPELGRSPLYYVQTGLMVVFLLVELLVDYVLKVDFRGIRWAVIVYVVLFFAASGGMLGVAAKNGAAWTIASAALFLIMAAMAFIQRAVTGM